MFCPGLTTNLLDGGSAAYACGVCQVLRIQPDEAMYLKTNMKRPGETGVITAELDLSYNRARRTTLSHSPAAE